MARHSGIHAATFQQATMLTTAAGMFAQAMAPGEEGEAEEGKADGC